MGVILIKKILKKSKKLRLRRRVCEYLVPETRRHKGTTGVCWESDMNGVSKIQSYGIASKGRSYNGISYDIRLFRAI